MMMMVLIVFVLNGKQTDFAKRHRERDTMIALSATPEW